MTDAPTPRKIAILGGGMGGLTTAWELSSQPGWRDRFEITVYQLGHRLGGKCASSRGPCDRIEEHGIHGFLGSYFNTLPMMADLYAELGRKPGEPLATFEEAFVGSDFSMLWEWVDGALKAWPSRQTPNAKSPKDGAGYEGLKSSVENIIVGVGAMLSTATGLPPAAQGAIGGLLAAANATLAAPFSAGPAHPLVALIQGARQKVGEMMGGIPSSEELRRAITTLDFLSSLIVAALMENVEVDGYDRLDDQNWTDVLLKHGIQPSTLASPVSVVSTNICYQNPSGDTSRTPEMGAGAYLNWTLKSFAFMGNMLWSFGAGTGETVVAPLYTVLKRRGVKFKFFHKVDALRLSPNDPKRVDAVDFTLQATLKQPEAGYEPLIDVLGLPSWPKTPLYDQLVQGEALAAKGVDLESWWNGWPDAAHPALKTPRTLRRGRDFDEVVFAISVGAVRFLCSELVDAEPAWRRMVEALPTVQTQATQIWLSKTVADLGFPEPLDTSKNEVACSATYVGPPNGNEEFHDLLKWETWPAATAPKAIWYFCGLMPSYEPMPPFSDTDYPKRQHDRVKAQFLQYLQSAVGTMLPGATSRSTQGVGDPNSLDFQLLVQPPQSEDDTDSKGAQRFDSQFWRANIDPSELYVASPPGSTAQRLEAWGSGFENLTLAGDWIYTGLNVGSFEGAAMSGKLASYALSGAPALNTIIGFPTVARPVMPGGPAAYPPPPHATPA